MPGNCTTCTEMYLNGAMTGMVAITTIHHPPLIQLDLLRVPVVSLVVAAGTFTLCFAVLLSVPELASLTRMAFSVSAWPAATRRSGKLELSTNDGLVAARAQGIPVPRGNAAESDLLQRVHRRSIRRCGSPTADDALTLAKGEGGFQAQF